MPEKMAIMKNVRYGVDDRDRVSLMFSTYVNDSQAADHWIQNPEAEQIIKDAHVSDVRRLDGRACYVDHDNGMMDFKRVAKI